MVTRYLVVRQVSTQIQYQCFQLMSACGIICSYSLGLDFSSVHLRFMLYIRSVPPQSLSFVLVGKFKCDRKIFTDSLPELFLVILDVPLGQYHQEYRKIHHKIPRIFLELSQREHASNEITSA